MAVMPLRAAARSTGVADESDPVVRDILEAATAEFAARGLPGARVDAIVEGTQTSKRMLYYHFGSKEGLYLAVLERAYRRVREGDADFRPDLLTPMEALRQWAGRVFDAFGRHADFIRLVMHENMQQGRQLKHSARVRDLSLNSIARVEAILARGVAQGLMRADADAMDVYTNLVALCFFHVSNRASFSAIFGEPAAADVHRRATIIETLERFVAASRPPRTRA